MDRNCDDNVDGGDLKGGIQGGAHRTAVYLGERCRYDHPSGPVDTPPERVSRNTLVERGVECGPARQTSAAPKIVPVAYPTTGNSSTVLYVKLSNITQTFTVRIIRITCTVALWRRLPDFWIREESKMAGSLCSIVQSCCPNPKTWYNRWNFVAIAYTS